ncbi:MAG: multicopper oxidase family protein [Gemmatimonadetes bacterium]|nr:multicopper oxidase family protein [Gemmatimonadota bacterium]
MKRLLRGALVALGAVGTAVAQPPDTARMKHDEHAGHEGMKHGTGANRMPPMPKGMRMPPIPGLEGIAPKMVPYLPGEGMDLATVPMATPRKLLDLADGDSLELVAGFVKRKLRGKELVMYGFNGQYPGPLIRVRQSARIVVHFKNQLDMPSAVHWHGLRLDNKSDGAPGVTQDPVPVGGTFRYELYFPDPGIYWYHPHVREDIQQDLGLYGNMLVDSPEPNYYNPANDEQVVMLDDLLIDDEGILPYGKDVGNYAIMGRFGNLFLVNGEPDYRLSVNKGDVVRFLFTNVANTRTFNLSFGDNPVKLVGADIGRFEREEMVETVVIAPAQRYAIEVKFDKPGTYPIPNTVQALNNFLGEFQETVDTIGVVTVGTRPTTKDHGRTFATLRTLPQVSAEFAPYRGHFDRTPDKDLLLTVNIQGLPITLTAFMSVDTMYFPPQEWVDGMRDMNWVSTSREVHWIMRDLQTKRENMDIVWNMKVGDVVKVRMTNDGKSMHPMSHPIHFHGQRLLVVARNGIPESNLAWRDTILLPVGQTVDLLIEATNPGKWMAHCHIAEHLEAGMMMVFTVAP